jgi:hypothetical protein
MDESRKDFERALEHYPQSRVFRHMINECDIFDGLRNRLAGEPKPPERDLSAVDSVFGMGWEEFRR